MLACAIRISDIDLKDLPNWAFGPLQHPETLTVNKPEEPDKSAQKFKAEQINTGENLCKIRCIEYN